MAWSAPVDPVSGTVITVAYALASILGPIRHLRVMAGNADPPGSSYVVVSDSTTGTTWRKIPGDAIGTGAITAANVAAGTITGDKLADLGVTAAEIADLTITGAKIAALTITGDKLADLGITGAKILAGTITGDKLANGGITAEEIANLTITGAKIAATTITGDKVVDGALTGAKMVTGAIGTTQLADGGVTSGKMAAGSVGATAVIDGSLTDAEIAAANKDGAAGTASMRTLGTGVTQAAAGNHTHAAQTISSTGSYTGNGGGARVISNSLGYEPTLVMVSISGTANGIAFIARNDVTTLMPAAGSTSAHAGGSLDASGFTVPTQLNVSGVTYTWTAIA